MKPFGSALLLLLGAVSGLFGSARENIHREFSRTSEKEVSVIVDVAFGSLVLQRGAGDHVAVVDYDESTMEKRKVEVSYEVSDGRGTLRIKLKKGSSHWVWDGSDDDEHRRTMTIRLTEDLPLDLELELGAGRGDLDFSGLQVSDLRISTGASSVELRCDEPNAIEANEISIESGVSKFTAMDLGNMNFRTLRFSGGVGAYKLDFGGTPRRSGDARLEVGLGSIVVNIPRRMQARLLYDDSWLSSFDLDDDFQKKRSGVYETEGFATSDPRLVLKIESGLGSVKVRRR